MSDLRFAFRQLFKTPGFTIAVVLVLGLGIGANTTIFTIVSSLYLREPPLVQNPGELVRVTRTTDRTTSGSLSYPDLAYYRDHQDVFTGLAAYDRGGTIAMARIGDLYVQLPLGVVTHNYFDVLGLRPGLGRWFLAEEDRTPDTHPVVVISDGLWRRHFGERPEAIGAGLELNGRRYTIVGVTPAGYRGLSPDETPPDAWVPVMMQPALLGSADHGVLERVPGEIHTWLQGIARLVPGVRVERARSQMTALAQTLERDYPEWNENTGVALHQPAQFHPRVHEQLRGLFEPLGIVVAVVLLIACANVALLLLARASARRRELGVRLAIGAARSRLVRQLLTESLVLALPAAVLGLGLAWWTADAAAGLLPGTFIIDFRPDLTVLGFTVVLSILTVLLFGLTPALLVSRHTIVDELRGAVERRERATLRSGLVVLQVALSIILVSGALLFVRSFDHANSLELGFDPTNKVAVSVSLRNEGYTEAEAAGFVRQATERLRALPGARHVAVTRMIPFRGVWSGSFTAEGVVPPSGGEFFDAGFNAVSAGYFATLGIPIVAGREFTVEDEVGALPGVVVNEALARIVWGDENPIGRVVGRGDLPRLTVVGVARNATYYDLGEDPQPQLYVNVLQAHQSRVIFVVASSGDPLPLVGPIERELRSLAPQLLITSAGRLENIVAAEMSSYRVMAALVSLFGLLALVLATAGLYGVLSYLVAQRTRELGVRMALGARRGQVAAVVLSRGLRLAIAGVLVGGVAAWFGSRLVSGLLFGVSPHDVTTFVSAPLVLLLVAAIASYVPARRASRVDPMEALRYE